MPTVNVQSHLEPGAEWHFVKDQSCSHEMTSKVNLGTYQNGDQSGTIYGLKCKNKKCRGLKYRT